MSTPRTVAQQRRALRAAYLDSNWNAFFAEAERIQEEIGQETKRELAARRTELRGDALKSIMRALLPFLVLLSGAVMLRVSLLIFGALLLVVLAVLRIALKIRRPLWRVLLNKSANRHRFNSPD